MTKQQQRQKAYELRNAQMEKSQLSKIICEKFIALLNRHQPDSVMCYLHCRSEVKTLETVSAMLEENVRVIIPYCTVDHNGDNCLGLWWLEDLSEVIPGTWGILEPLKSRWADKEKHMTPEQLDLVMVPGVAFDLEGGRLGNGAGYYDRLLQEVRSDTYLAGLCYQSQIVDKVVMEEHDVFMHCLLTEKKNYSF